MPELRVETVSRGAEETMSADAPKYWRCGATYSTHNAPIRNWETVISDRYGTQAIAIGATESESVSNARIISSAVNAHEDLLAACKLAFMLPRPWMGTGQPTYEQWSAAFDKIEAAIAKAEGQP